MASTPEQDVTERRLSSSSDELVGMVEVEDMVSVLNLKLKPEEKYPAKLHARNVAKCLGVSKGLIYLPGKASEEYEDSDQPVFFRQRRYFYYLSGLDNPDCYVTYDIEEDDLIAWIPGPNTGINVIFNGSNPSTDEISEKYEFDEVKTVKYLRYYIEDFDSSQGAKIYVLGSRTQAPFESPSGLIQRPRTEALSRQSMVYWRGLNVDTVHLKPAMNACRVIKTPYEIRMIRKANEISTEAHVNVLKSIKQLSNESEIEAIFAGTCIAADAKSQAYGIIAGSGSNASTLHYVANNEPLKGRQLVCLDAGCEWKLYASDVTRTFPISGKYTPEAQAIYDIVAQMQEECIGMIQPGADFRVIVRHAELVAIKGLMSLGLLHNGTFEEVYIAGASLAFFPHGLGHYVGLEVHDVGAVSDRLLFQQNILRSSPLPECLVQETGLAAPATSILEENMVVTVEPGIYFNRYALEEVWLKNDRIGKYVNKDLLEKYYPVGGVRIEDDILVTKDGYENLTTTPKGDEALEIINGGGEVEEGVWIEKVEGRRGWFW